MFLNIKSDQNHIKIKKCIEKSNSNAVRLFKNSVLPVVYFIKSYCKNLLIMCTFSMLKKSRMARVSSTKSWKEAL